MSPLISDTAFIHPSVVIGKNVIIEEFVTIGKPMITSVREKLRGAIGHQSYEQLAKSIKIKPVKIGSGSVIRSHTVIYEDCEVGENFECGHNVILRNGVKVGSNTYLKNNSELMKNVRVGDDCRIAGIVADHAVIGSRVSAFGTLTHNYNRYYTPDMSELRAATVGDGAILGRGSIVVGDVTIGAGAIVGAGTTIWSDVGEGERVRVQRAKKYRRRRSE